MIDTVDKTSKLAEVISDKVRQLDQEQSRARQAIQYVEDVQELKFCVASLQEAIQQKEYDEAAVLLQRASKIDPAILNGSLAEFTVVGYGNMCVCVSCIKTKWQVDDSLHPRIPIIQ